MKCYEFHHSHPSFIQTGMTVTNDEKVGKIIFLGINNQKSKAVRVALDKNNPAVIRDNKMVEAWPRTVNQKQNPFVVLQKPLRSSYDVLLRVNTSSCSDGSVINGSWRNGVGDPKQIFTTNGRRQQTIFCDDILQLAPGDSIIVNMEGDETEYELKNEKGKIKVYSDKGEMIAPEANGNLKAVEQEIEKVPA